jgi:hypothetical protein
MPIQHGEGLSPWAPKPDPERAKREQRKRLLLIGVRYVVPGLIALAGIVTILAANDTDVGIEIGGMFLGAAVAVFLLNFFYRMGVSGEKDRDAEQEARDYFDQHGHWPDEPAR